MFMGIQTLAYLKWNQYAEGRRIMIERNGNSAATRGLPLKEVTVNGRKASADGPIKTFPLRGIKDSPPYLHDDRLLTLDDTVEFFNLVLELKLNEQEKKDLVAFMRVL
jgi:cytochrome c peroxidase